jgi:VanZ family protein
MPGLRHRWFWLCASAVLVLGVIWGSLQTGTDIAVPAGFDKVEHFGTYLFLAVWFTGMVRRGRYWVVVAALLLLGLALEIGQDLMHRGRTADPDDMAANTAGVALGIVVAWLATGGWTQKVDAWLSRS